LNLQSFIDGIFLHPLSQGPRYATVEEPPPNVVNEFNPNEIVRDPGLRKQIHLYVPDIQDDVRRAYLF
jgi:hypothetical protein